jgi:hypothetical protein
VGWRGIMLPKGTPPEIVRVLNEHLAPIAASEEFRQFMKKNGFDVTIRDAAEFALFLRGQESKWGEVIKSAGYTTLGQNHDPGPRAMPILLATLLIIVLVAEGVASRKRGRQDDARSLAAKVQERAGIKEALVTPVTASIPAGNSRDALFMLIALAIYIAVMPWTGFIVATALFALIVMWRLGAKWWLAALGSLVIVASIHLLFVELFKVQLP